MTKWTQKRLVTRLSQVMRLCVVCGSQAWGGLEQVVVSDVMDLAQTGLRFSVLCAAGSPLAEALKNIPNVQLEFLSPLTQKWFHVRLGWEVKKRVLEKKANLFHFHQTTVLPAVVPWFWRDRKTVLITSRHLWNRHRKQNWFYQAVYQRLDAFVVMSQALKKNVFFTHHLKERQLKVIHLGLNFDVFHPDRADPLRFRKMWGVDDNTVVIGMVSRIDPLKGQDVFLKAAAGLKKKLRKGEKLKFVIVGEPTKGTGRSYMDFLKTLVHQYQLEESVVFTGYQDDIPSVMRAFDIFVFPSLWETFGLVAIEAMAMETPVVMSRGGSAEEILGAEEQRGLFVRPQDPYGLQVKLRKFLDQPLERVKMGELGRAFVLKHFDRKVRLQRHLELYERSLRRRGWMKKKEQSGDG